MIRGRKPAGGGVHNPPSRGAVYDQRTYGSVGAGAGNRPGYPRAAMVAGALAAGPRPVAHASRVRPGTGQAAAGSLLVVAHSAANTAGERIASAECGRRQLLSSCQSPITTRSSARHENSSMSSSSSRTRE